VNILVEVRRLKKYYPIQGGVFRKRMGDIKAVDGVNLKIRKGECLGLVGESGCGKTTLGKTILRLLKPTKGHIYFDVSEEIKQKVEKLEESRDSNSQRNVRRGCPILSASEMSITLPATG